MTGGAVVLGLPPTPRPVPAWRVSTTSPAWRGTARLAGSAALLLRRIARLRLRHRLASRLRGRLLDTRALGDRHRVESADRPGIERRTPRQQPQDGLRRRLEVAEPE